MDFLLTKSDSCYTIVSQRVSHTLVCVQKKGAKMEAFGTQNLIFGTYRYCLDDKNRVRVPVSFAKVLGESFVIMPGRQGCFYLVSKELAPSFLGEFASISPYDPKSKEKNEIATRIFAMSRPDAKLDAQSRLNLDKELQATYKVEKELVFVGKANFVEVWPAEVWDRLFGILSPESLDSILDRLASLGE